MKKSSIENHMKLSKHVKGKERVSKKKPEKKDLAESLHLQGETLPQAQQVFRVKVLKAFL